jgi:hypothetical protein
MLKIRHHVIRDYYYPGPPILQWIIHDYYSTPVPGLHPIIGSIMSRYIIPSTHVSAVEKSRISTDSISGPPASMTTVRP